jgi:hypothetical protein
MNHPVSDWFIPANSALDRPPYESSMLLTVGWSDGLVWSKTWAMDGGRPFFKLRMSSSEGVSLDPGVTEGIDLLCGVGLLRVDGCADDLIEDLDDFRSRLKSSLREAWYIFRVSGIGINVCPAGNVIEMGLFSSDDADEATGKELEDDAEERLFIFEM